MTSANGCLTAADAARLVRREVSGADLLRMTDHLEHCESCQALLDAARVPGSGVALVTAVTATDTPHLSEDDVHAYVGDRLSVAQRADVDEHLRWCEACAADVSDLRAFAATLPPAPAPAADGPAARADAGGSRRGWWLAAALAAAAVLIAAVFLRPTPPAAPAGRPAQIVASLRDGTRTVSLDAEGHLASLDDVPADVRDRIAQALASGALAIPRDAASLAPPASPLMGSNRASAEFGVTAPIATRVLDGRPGFAWTPLAGARTYTVTVASADGAIVVTSPAVTASTWTPDTPLPDGRRYSWQVAARRADGTEVLAPVPPAPPALFEVIDAGTATRLAALPASSVARAVAFAEAGVLDEAERELVALSGANAGSTIVANWLAQVRGARGGRPTAPLAGR